MWGQTRSNQRPTKLSSRESATAFRPLRADVVERFAHAKVETQRLIIAGMVANAIAVITALLA